MKASNLPFIALLVLCIGCTTKTSFPPGPMPELVINAPGQAIRSALIADMVNGGYSLSAETEHMVRFYRVASGEGAVGFAYITSALTGMGGRKDAQRIVSYTLTPAGTGYRVTVSSVLSGDGIHEEMTGHLPVYNEYIAQLRVIRSRLEAEKTITEKN